MHSIFEHNASETLWLQFGYRIIYIARRTNEILPKNVTSNYVGTSLVLLDNLLKTNNNDNIY